MKNYINTQSVFVLSSSGDTVQEVKMSCSCHLYGNEVIEEVYEAVLRNPSILEEAGPVALLTNDGRTVVVMQNRKDACHVRRVFSAIRHGMKELANIADSLWEFSPEEGVSRVCSL